MRIWHPFVSAKADGTDATLVKPTNWNADHNMTTGTDGVVLGRLAGAGAGDVQELPFGAVLPYGTVLPFAGPTSPTGWLICDGSSLVRATYPGLFAAIGVAYGAVDGAHFSIPDLRGRTIAGLDPSGTRLTNATVSPNGNTLGAVGGQQQVSASISGHCFGFIDASGSWGGTTYYVRHDGPYAAAGAGEGAGSSFVYNGTASWLNASSLASVGNIRNDGNNTISGSTTNATNVQPTLLMNWIIKT